MMKRQKRLLILLAVLALVVGAIILAKTAAKHNDSIDNTDEEILSISAEDIQKISWEKEGATLEFTKEDDTWSLTGDADFPVSEKALNEVFSHLASVHASFQIGDVEDYDQYGLKNPEGTMTITTVDQEYTIQMGGFSTMDSKRYVTLDGDTVYLIDDDLLSDVSSARDDYLDQDTLPDYTQITGVQTTGQNEMNIVYDETQHTYSTAYHYYEEDNGSYRALSTTGVENFTNRFANANLTDYVTYAATAEDLTACGFDDPELTVTIEGDVTDDSDAKSDETVSKSTTIMISTAEEKHYLHYEDSPIIYNLDDDTYEKIMDVTVDSLLPEDILTLNWDEVESIKAESDGQEYTVEMLHKNNDQGEELAEIGDTEISAAKLKNAITDMQLAEGKSDAEKGALEFSFTIQQDNEIEQTLTVDLYRYDGDNCVVVINGETLGLMSRSQMTDVKEAFTSAVLSAQ